MDKSRINFFLKLYSFYKQNCFHLLCQHQTININISSVLLACIFSSFIYVFYYLFGKWKLGKFIAVLFSHERKNPGQENDLAI